MNTYLKRFIQITVNASVYVTLFFSFHYIFKDDPFTAIIIPIYFIFMLVCFTFFLKKTLKIGGRLHLFSILTSALFFVFIFQDYQLSYTSNDYMLVLGVFFGLSFIASFIKVDHFTKKQNITTIILLAVCFIIVFIAAIFFSDHDILWLFVLLLFKIIPFVAAYHLSKALELSYERLFFLTTYIFVVMGVMIYGPFAGAVNVITFKEMISEKV